MERLGHRIDEAISNGSWSPFRFIRNGTPLSHLFFVDDLILYSKADLVNAKVIEDILAEFGSSSGHRVSKQKTQIWFSPNTDPMVKDSICASLGFQVVENLGKYLGVPVIHKRVTRADYSFIIDKLRSRLSGWVAKTLSLAGRATLAKSVLSSIYVYFMQSTLLPKGVCDDIEKIVRQFVWGNSTFDRKISLVNWEVLRQPMENGGLGFRNMYAYNVAFVHKVGFTFISKPNTLWVSLLRQKYRIVEMCPHSIRRSTGSPLWRALTNHWDSIRSSIAWSLGNDHSVSLLDDVWIPSLGPLRTYTLLHAEELDTLSIPDLINANGTWNLDLLPSIFPRDVITHILSIKCPEPSDPNDVCVWRWNPLHSSSISSAYKFLSEMNWDPVSSTWKMFWKCPVPQRILFFIWLVYRQKLMTNSERCRRRLSDNPACPGCAHPLESCCHALRDCPEALDVWMRIVPAALHDSFYSMNTADWLRCNLTSRLIHPKFNLQWLVLFASALRKILKRRNELVFIGTSQPSSTVLRLSLAWARCYENTRPLQYAALLPQNHVVQWSPPIRGCLCLNVDGSSASSTKLNVVGGLLREILEVQSDCKQAVKLVTDSDAGNSSFSLVRAIDKLRGRAWLTDIIWIPRDANRPADYLAKLADPTIDSLAFLEEPHLLRLLVFLIEIL
ncbi:hypothetical protein HRI_002298200 [Hibiscus trionum]|uniref:Reverse transcriptase zinc-binding domain-containing protein n=1 Tax=Hibiscus trionum TaxID=183268 RepID=A0A9W7HZ32_HIBTR|nr:hypothetical protein HRI_002298200 [Hibiscus trionum]